MVIHKRCRKLPLKPHNLFCPPRFHFVCSSGQVFIVAIRPLPAFLRLPQDQKPIALKVFSSSFPKLNGPLLFRKCSVICFCHLSGLFPKKKKKFGHLIRKRCVSPGEPKSRESDLGTYL